MQTAVTSIKQGVTNLITNINDWREERQEKREDRREERILANLTDKQKKLLEEANESGLDLSPSDLKGMSGDDMAELQMQIVANTLQTGNIDTSGNSGSLSDVTEGMWFHVGANMDQREIKTDVQYVEDFLLGNIGDGQLNDAITNILENSSDNSTLTEEDMQTIIDMTNEVIEKAESYTYNNTHTEKEKANDNLEVDVEEEIEESLEEEKNPLEIIAELGESYTNAMDEAKETAEAVFKENRDGTTDEDGNLVNNNSTFDDDWEGEGGETWEDVFEELVQYTALGDDEPTRTENNQRTNSDTYEMFDNLTQIFTNGTKTDADGNLTHSNLSDFTDDSPFMLAIEGLGNGYETDDGSYNDALFVLKSGKVYDHNGELHDTLDVMDIYCANLDPSVHHDDKPSIDSGLYDYYYDPLHGDDEGHPAFMIGNYGELANGVDNQPSSTYTVPTTGDDTQTADKIHGGHEEGGASPYSQGCITVMTGLEGDNGMTLNTYYHPYHQEINHTESGPSGNDYYLQMLSFMGATATQNEDETWEWNFEPLEGLYGNLLILGQ